MERSVFVYRGDGDPEEILIERRGSACTFTRGGRVEHADAAELGDGRLSLVFEDGRQICGRVAVAATGLVAVAQGSTAYRLSLAEPLTDRLAHAQGGEHAGDEREDVRALMPGRVVEVAVKVGENVPAGGLLLVLEAMKMQNEIRSARGGTVLSAPVEKGRAVEGGALLMTLEPRPNPIG
jgi:biotin carboxyl carrier protein